VSFDGVDLPDAVRTLALQAGLNIQFDPKLVNQKDSTGNPLAPPKVTEKWHNVTAMQALLALLENWGWQMIQDPKSRIARITAKDPLSQEPLITTVYQLRYTSPSNIINEVKPPAISSRSAIIMDDRTHQLILLTTEKELPTVEALIDRLDKPTRQVLIEAKLIETTKDPKSVKGIDWSGTLAAQNVSFGNGLTTVNYNQGIVNSPNSSSTTAPGGRPLGSSGLSTVSSNATSILNSITGSTTSGGGFSLNTMSGINPATAFLNADGVHAVLSFLNTDADTRSISLPRTVALDGIATELMVVRNIPVFEQQQSAPAAGAASGLATVKPNYELKVNGTVLNEVGVKLLVTPRIAGLTNVLLDLKPEVSSEEVVQAQSTLGGQIQQSPIFDRRRITTSALVPSGYTLVLGGLDSDVVSKGFSKVPFLGDVPFIGYAFRQDTKEHSKDTIMIFVTPTIIKDVDLQPSISHFIKTKMVNEPDVEEPIWDAGKPYDWTKPNAKVAPVYEPASN